MPVASNRRAESAAPSPKPSCASSNDEVPAGCNRRAGREACRRVRVVVVLSTSQPETSAAVVAGVEELDPVARHAAARLDFVDHDMRDVDARAIAIAYERVAAGRAGRQRFGPAGAGRRITCAGLQRARIDGSAIDAAGRARLTGVAVAGAIVGAEVAIVAGCTGLAARAAAATHARLTLAVEADRRAEIVRARTGRLIGRVVTVRDAGLVRRVETDAQLDVWNFRRAGRMTDEALRRIRGRRAREPLVRRFTVEQHGLRRVRLAFDNIRATCR